MRLVLLFIILIQCPVLVSAQNGNVVKDTLLSELNNLSDIHRKTTIHVGPSIPNYHINYVGKLLSGTLDPTRYFYEINISKGSNDKPFQTISDTVDFITIGPGINADRFPDINFDGYTDLPLERNDTYEFWLFDKHSGKFVKNEIFSGLHFPIIHSTKKKIIINAVSSDDIRTYSIYRVVNQKLKLEVRNTTNILHDLDSVRYKIKIEEQFKNRKVDTVKSDTIK